MRDFSIAENFFTKIITKFCEISTYANLADFFIFFLIQTMNLVYFIWCGISAVKPNISTGEPDYEVISCNNDQKEPEMEIKISRAYFEKNLRGSKGKVDYSMSPVFSSYCAFCSKSKNIEEIKII